MLPYVESRLAFLAAAQNADGGWGYSPGKRSWLEPTAYALLALYPDPRRRAAFDRGWTLVRSWQRDDGGWPACAGIGEAHWTTALAVTLHCVTGVCDVRFRRGVAWLRETAGAESGLLVRLAHFLRPSVVEFDPRLTGWPWQPGTSSWIEPTAHTLMALKRAAARYSHPPFERRIEIGERMLLERRARDGGWNHGNRRVLGTDLPSYPESTALALLGLAGNRSLEWEPALRLAQRFWRETSSPLAWAWLTACLHRFGVPVPEPREGSCKIALEPGADIYLAAIEALAWNRVLG